MPTKKEDEPKEEKPKLKKVKTAVHDSVASIDVFDKKDHFIRTYSKEVHGEGFKELAIQFSGKINGQIKPTEDKAK